MTMTDSDLRVEIVPQQRGGGPQTARGQEVAATTVERTLTDRAQIDTLYTMYLEAFTPLSTRAAMCHVLAPDEFADLLVHPEVLKIVSWDADGVPVAMMTLTTELGTERIGADFFRQRFPEEHAAGELYYLGFLLVHPDAPRTGVLPQLIRAGVEQISRDGGVVAFDVCRFNDETYKFAQICAMLASRVRPAALQQIDVQTYYALSFPATG